MNVSQQVFAILAFTAIMLILVGEGTMKMVAKFKARKKGEK